MKHYLGVLLGSLLCAPTQAEGASRRKPPFGTSIQNQDPRWTRNCGKAQAFGKARPHEMIE